MRSSEEGARPLGSVESLAAQAYPRNERSRWTSIRRRRIAARVQVPTSLERSSLPYGSHGSEQVARFIDIIKNKLIEIKDDGSIWLNQEYFSYATGLRMVYDDKWAEVLGFKRRESESLLEQIHCDFALAIQEVTEEVVIKMAQEAKRLTGSKNLCLAGGVALNCVANGKLQKTNVFENVYIQPAAGDAGGALGAAQAAYHIYFGQERIIDKTKLDGMKGSYLGPEYSDLEIEQMSRKYDASFERFEDFDALAAKTASLLADGSVIGWFQGRMEFGPRALGGRSILGDARNAEKVKPKNQISRRIPSVCSFGFG